MFVAAVVSLFQTAFVGGLLFFQLFGCGLGAVALIGGNGAAAVSKFSGCRLRQPESGQAGLLVPALLVDFVFGKNIVPPHIPAFFAHTGIGFPASARYGVVAAGVHIIVFSFIP